MGSAIECLDIRCDISIKTFAKKRGVRCLGGIVDSAGGGSRAMPLGNNPKGCPQWSASQLIDHYDGNILGVYSPCSLFEARGAIDLNPDSGVIKSLRSCCGDNPPNAGDSFAVKGSDMPQNCTDYVKFAVKFQNPGVILCKQPKFVNDPCEDCKTVFATDPMYLDIGWKASKILSKDMCHVPPATQLPAQQVTSIKIEGSWDTDGKVFSLSEECKNGLEDLTICLWDGFYHRPTDIVIYDIVFRLRSGGAGGVFRGISGDSTTEYPYDGCYCLSKPQPIYGKLGKHCNNWRFQVPINGSCVACNLAIPSKHNWGTVPDGPYGGILDPERKEASSDSPCELLAQAAMDTSARGEFGAGNLCQPSGSKGSSNDLGMPPKAMNNAMGGNPVLFESTVTDSRINTGNCPEGLAGYGSAGSPTTINMWDSNPKGYGLGSFYVSGVAENYSYVSWTGGAAITGSKILNPSGVPNWYPRMASDGTINTCASGVGNATGAPPENYPPGMGGGEIPAPPPDIA